MTSTASQPIINTDLVLLDVDAGGDKQTVIGRLVSRLADAGPHSRHRRTDRRGDGARRAVGHRAARRHRDPALPLAVRRHRLDRVRPAEPGGRLRRARRTRRSGVPDRGPGSRRRRAHEAAVQPRPGPGAQGLRRVAAQRVDARRSRRAGRRRRQRDGRKAQARSRTREGNAQDAGRRHRMPDRHRAHLHGRRLAGRRRQEGRCDAARGDAGLVGQHAAGAVDHRRGRRGHLRHRRRRQGQTALRRQARRRIRRQARDQRTRQDGRRSACRRGRTRTPPASG